MRIGGICCFLTATCVNLIRILFIALNRSQSLSQSSEVQSDTFLMGAFGHQFGHPGVTV